MTFSIELAADCDAAIRKHSEEAFPEECCGALLGIEDENGIRRITQIIKVENTKGENRERRFLISPKEVMLAERSAREQKMDVLGIYHSHPNHPSQASNFDRDHAMPFWSYVIVSCLEGKSASMQSFRLKEDRSAFDEENLTIGA